MDLNRGPVATSPQVRVARRKSYVRTPAEVAAIDTAVEAIRGVPITNPLFLDGAPVGLLRSDHTREVWFSPVTKINDIIVALEAGQSCRRNWVKQIGSLSPITLKWNDLWCAGGKPQAGTYTGTAHTARQFDDTVAGGLAHGGNVSPKQKFIKDGWVNSFGAAALLWAYDRVLAYESNTPTNGVTTMTNTLAAQRYNGAGLPGLLVMPTIQTVIATGPALSAMSYVNQAGSTIAAPLSSLIYILDTHGATQTNLQGSNLALVTTNNHAVPFVPLGVSDTGVRSINSVTFNAADTGSVCFALVRPLVMLANSGAQIPAMYDWLHQMPELDAIVYDGAHISFMQYLVGSAQQWGQGGLGFGWG